MRLKQVRRARRIRFRQVRRNYKKVSVSAPYTIEANKIRFMDEMSYEVVQLTESQLTVILHLNFPGGIPLFKNGPFAELIYEPLVSMEEES
jgi:hypothetical protein